MSFETLLQARLSYEDRIEIDFLGKSGITSYGHYLVDPAALVRALNQPVHHDSPRAARITLGSGRARIVTLDRKLRPQTKRAGHLLLNVGLVVKKGNDVEQDADLR